ncbi:MAG TPA: hypothetical protein VIK84_04105 [Haloplasmataceae bacterium]
MYSFMQYFDLTMEIPKMLGWYHLMWLGILFVSVVSFYIKFRNTSDKTNKKIIIVFTIIFFLLETYKQINYTLSAGHYQWYVFPFQFCSIPLYLLPIMIFLKEGKLKNIFYEFIATFIFVAGISVMIYPESVYTDSLGINLQTMIHHSMMVIIALYVIFSGRAKLTVKGFFNAVLVFLAFVFIADMMNIIFHNFIIPDHDFNMFMISPYYPNNMPLLMTLKEKTHYMIFLLAYLLSFSLLAFIAFTIGHGIQKLNKKCN